MFGFFKKIFCPCDSLEQRQKAAYKQDQKIRDDLNERQIDKGLKDTMEASDPVAKY